MIKQFEKFELSTKEITNVIGGNAIDGGPLQDELDQYAQDSENENWGQQAQDAQDLYNYYGYGS